MFKNIGDRDDDDDEDEEDEFEGEQSEWERFFLIDTNGTSFVVCG